MNNENALSGYVKLYRSIINWEWFKDSNTVHVFLCLMALAAFKDGRWQGTEIKKGQVICSRATLSEKTGLSEQNIKTALKHLKSTSEITIETTSRFSLVTLVNYTKYQEYEREVTSEVTGEVTLNQPASNQQVTSDQPHRKNVNTLKPVKPVNNNDERFEEFWELYPKKQAKQPALKSFTKLNPSEELFAIICNAVVQQSKTSAWTKENGQYIPMASTWLNCKRWEDEIKKDTKQNGIIDIIKHGGTAAWSEEEIKDIFG